MDRKDKIEKLFLSKIIFTLMILSLYKILRCIPLYGVDTLAYEKVKTDADIFIQQAVGGDYYRYSIMALGITPYMIANMLVMIINVLTPKERRARTSPRGLNRVALFITVILAISLASIQIDKLIFVEDILGNDVQKIVALLEMVTGALLMVWIAGRNKKYGIGGQSAIFIVNIIDNIMVVINKNTIDELKVPIGVGCLLLWVMLFVENCEKRIPLQRISIHNIYADKNYQAIKFNPVGILPMIFSSAFFVLPQLLTSILVTNWPNNPTYIYMNDNMSIQKPLGVAIYLLGVFILNIGFTFIMLSPKDIAEQFLKSGDSFVGIHPGKNTKRYLRKHLFLISFISSIVMSLCLMASFHMIIVGGVKEEVAMLPTSLMMLTGLFCSLFQEATAVYNTDRYKDFI